MVEFWGSSQELVRDYAWIARIVALAAFILLMVMVVALLYSGEVQNSEKGPISLVAKSTLNDQAFQAIDPIITNNLDGKKAYCTFYLSYLDRNQRPRKKRLHRARFEFKKLNRSPSREEASTLVGYWNPPRHEELQNVLERVGIVPDAPNLFAEQGELQPGTRSHIDQYFSREIAETRTVAVSNSTLAAIGAAQAKFLREEFAKIERIPRDKNGVRRLEGKAVYNSLPNLSEDGHYFVEMKFDINPVFVLTDHPDGQVKTTAWLTVLTSLFAMFMQVIYNGFG
ncbi:MAG: hypothetical protein K2P70_05465 [Hyphomonadaceae bacterium]|nr:hypothetical protein [Hyphomonadaceae bacterium]